MLRKKIVPGLALCQVLGLWVAAPVRAMPGTQSPETTATVDKAMVGSAETRPTEPLLASIQTLELRELASEVLARNPAIARAERLAAVAAAKAPQVRALPDPMAAVTLFVLPPETRAGPQRLQASLQQKFPGFDKLKLREKAALYAAAAARAEARTVRLDKLHETRELGSELVFLEAYERIVKAERSTLVRYEKAAQARYAAGTGLQQESVRIQAQITRADTRLLEIFERRSVLRTHLNRLRDRPAEAPIASLANHDPFPASLDSTLLRSLAQAHRPELAAAEARVAAGSALVALAEKSFRPDFTVGFSYTAVDRRDDAPARLAPPADDGDDILALTTSLNLPVRRQKLAAGLEEAQASKWAAEEEKRAVLAEIESTIGDLTTRLPLLREHLSLLENVLIKQAREALRSAETAYSTGKLNAIDLLDSEVVLLEVQIAAARTRADLAVAWASLERAIGRSLPTSHSEPAP